MAQSPIIIFLFTVNLYNVSKPMKIKPNYFIKSRKFNIIPNNREEMVKIKPNYFIKSIQLRPGNT